MKDQNNQNKLSLLAQCSLKTNSPINALVKFTPVGDFLPIYVENYKLLADLLIEIMEFLAGMKLGKTSSLYITIRGNQLTIEEAA